MPCRLPSPHLIALKLYSFDLPHPCYYILTSNLSPFITPEPVSSTAFFSVFTFSMLAQVSQGFNWCWPKQTIISPVDKSTTYTAEFVTYTFQLMLYSPLPSWECASVHKWQPSNARAKSSHDACSFNPPVCWFQYIFKSSFTHRATFIFPYCCLHTHVHVYYNFFKLGL